MIWVVLLLAQAADPGAAIFYRSCAVGYCHGVDGAASGAPRLAGRGFDEAYIDKVTRNGVAGTTMPAWKDTLSEADLRAVVAYVAKLSGEVAPRRRRAAAMDAPATPPVRRSAPPEAKPGRNLFFDAVRGVHRCGTCHQADGWGLNVAPVSAPKSVAELRTIPTKRVQTARIPGEPPFAALAVDDTRVYDLTAPPPVLRTAESVTLAPGANWSHTACLAPYNDAELEQILIFLRWAIAERP